VAYFETSPAKPFLTSTVTSDASFSRNGGGHMQGLRYYRQALAVRFVPAHFPDTPLANEPAPPATDPCGTLTAAEQAAITPQAESLMNRLGGTTIEVVATKP
jgi:hypothetical protein